MLLKDVQMEEMTVDVAGVFLDALVQAVEGERLRVNTRRNGHVFITAEFWFVTYPVGVGDLTRWIRTRRDGPRHDFVRDEIVQALRSGGYLLGCRHGRQGQGHAAVRHPFAGLGHAAGTERPSHQGRQTARACPFPALRRHRRLEYGVNASRIKETANDVQAK